MSDSDSDNISMNFLPLVLFTALLSGCGGSQLPPKEIESVNFNGLRLPGRAADAKAAGFTECKGDYYGYTCRMAKAFDVLGVSPATASLVLNGRAVFVVDRAEARDATGDVRLLPTESLAYDEIRLDLVAPSYDEKCIARARRNASDSFGRPSQCLKAGSSIDNLQESLEKGGWKKVSARRYSIYMHPQEGVSITLQDNRASIGRVDPAARSSSLASLAAREAEVKARENAGRAFTESMAK